MRWQGPPIASVLVVALLVAGCGGDDEPSPETPSVERRAEKPGKLPDLPRGYERAVNKQSGIVFGRPPGWAAQTRRPLTVMRAPDKLVAVSISVDRSDGALATPAAEFATRTTKALGGYRKPLEPSKPKAFAHPYRGAEVKAEGVSANGVRQDIRVIVLRRTGVATVTVIVAANAKEQKRAAPEVKQALESLQTLRTRPPADPAAEGKDKKKPRKSGGKKDGEGEGRAGAERN